MACTSCLGGNPGCVNCSGLGTVDKPACRRCSGKGTTGSARCLDCRGQGWRSVEDLNLTDPATEIR